MLTNPVCSIALQDQKKKNSGADPDPHLNRFATTEFVFVLRCSHHVKCNTGNYFLFGAALRVGQVNGREFDVVVFEKFFNHEDRDRVLSTHNIHRYSCRRRKKKQNAMGLKEINKHLLNSPNSWIKNSRPFHVPVFRRKP